MDISPMTTLKPPAAGSSEEKLAAPDKAVFEEELQEKMSPPGDAAPPPPTGVEGAMRTEADVQPNADDQTLDQPQEASLLEAFNTVMLWQAVVPAAPTQTLTVPTDVVAAAVDATDKTNKTDAISTGEEAPEMDAEIDSVIEGEATKPVKGEATLEDAAKANEVAVKAPEGAAQNAAVAEQVSKLESEMTDESEESDEVTIENVEAETTAAKETPKPAQEQIQIKPHSLDRPARALEEVQEARQPNHNEGNIRGAVVKMALVSETFGNLNMSIKAFGQSVEADVQTQSPDLNRALNVHRPDLVQAVESKGLSLSQFDVRQQNQSQTPDQGQGHPQDQPASKEDLERMARLNLFTGTDAPAARAPSGLLNTLA